MCRLLIIPGLKPENIEDNWEFIEEMGAAMSDSNRDGLGYVSLSPDSDNICIERWHNNDEAFDVRSEVSELSKKYKGFLKEESVSHKYVQIGQYLNEISAVLLHTRMATTARTFVNTHPFYDEKSGTTLIHNGVIRNVETADNIRSTCDSERILNKYLEHNVSSNPSNIQKVVDDLEGNFACGVLSHDGKDVIIDIFKSRASLYGAFVHELGCMVFSTSLKDIQSVCKKLNMTITNKFECKDDMLIRFNARTGEVLLTQEYKDTAQYKTPVYNSNYQNYYQQNNRKELTDKVTSTINEDIEKSKKVIKDTMQSELRVAEAAVDGWFYHYDSLTWFKK